VSRSPSLVAGNRLLLLHALGRERSEHVRAAGRGAGERLAVEAVEAARRLNVWNKPFCQGCFIKWHCAGGCHVNHVLPGQAGDYGRLCIQARAIALCSLLQGMGQGNDIDALLADREVLARAVCQPTDRIEDVAKGL